jgi:hypothetical protein
MSSQKRRRRHKGKDLCQLEPLFQGVKVALMHDLAGEDLRRLYCMKARGSEVQDVNVGCPPYMFKKIQQLKDFDKRIIWATDESFDSLSAKAINGFVESQQTFICPEPMSRRAVLVIQKAKEICTEILGPFSYDDWFDSCAFGKRAAVDLPRRDSYLDTRFERINGTKLQIQAFRHMLSRDVHLLRAVRKRARTYRVCDSIKATTVPKSWKAARVIAPDTILGGLLSRGLGAVIRNQLEKNTHIDLALQQERHRRWAKVASETGHLSTIDMSKASDSFTWRHIELMVPDDWHHALDVVRTRRCETPSGVIDLRSYMLMGSGHTFPLQTLLFFCLAEATRRLLKSRGSVSVYGDDIIVPTRIAKPFIVVMSELGFVINSEKSFYDDRDPDRPSHTFFRESCGGDYKGGIDVRPYMPECDLQQEAQVPCNEYLAWCHKMVNGLLDHWHLEEIPLAVGFLLREINNRKRKICFVPEWEVDHSGIKHYIPPYFTLGLDCSYITYEHSVPVYWRLTFHRKKRRRKLEERPYVWYAYWLNRTTSPVEDLYDVRISLGGEPKKSTRGAYRWKQTAPKKWKSNH